MFNGPSGVYSRPGEEVRHHGSRGSHKSHGSHGSQGSQGSQETYGYVDDTSGNVGGSQEGHDSPAMSHHGHGAGGHKQQGGEGSHLMSMAFHTGATETILFNFWRTQSAAALALSCLLIFVVGILYEGLKFFREWLFQKGRATRLDAGRDHYGHHRHHREQEYIYRRPTYSYRVHQQQPQQQQQQGQVQIYSYRAASSSMPPHLHSDSAQSLHMPQHHHHHFPHPIASPSEQSLQIMPPHHHHAPHSLVPPSGQASNKMPLHHHMPHSNTLASPESSQLMPQHHHHLQRSMGPPPEQSLEIMPHHHTHLPHGPGQHHIQQDQDRGSVQKIPWRRRWCSRLHLFQTFLHVLQVLISFLLMLVFMTFNVWLGLAVLLGAGVGYYIFGAFSNRINEHCN